MDQNVGRYSRRLVAQRPAEAWLERNAAWLDEKGTDDPQKAARARTIVRSLTAEGFDQNDPDFHDELDRRLEGNPRRRPRRHG